MLSLEVPTESESNPPDAPGAEGPDRSVTSLIRRGSRAAALILEDLRHDGRTLGHQAVLRRVGHAAVQPAVRAWSREFRRDRLQAELAAARQAAARAERERILRDLHDGCGGQLVSALRMAESGVTAGQIADVLRDCIDNLRTTLDALDPDVQELGPALAGLRDRFEARLAGQALRLEWTLHTLPRVVTRDASHCLQVMRILQEALANVVKHAGARVVQVDGWVCGDGDAELCLRVSDDGTGFCGSLRGRGLDNMQQRAGALGGRLAVRSGPIGTVVELRFPIQPG